VLVELVKSSKKDKKTFQEGGSEQLSPSSFYIENGKYVFTKEFHLNRGYCCGSGCRHCPFYPAHKKGNTTIFIENG
jgi:hypothetical protein